ncbi:MAG: beta-propeller domain-containing protein [Polyangiaceae bacterium]|nr:beta-propeller domain-containing protein [Polyangiaceae bacterium]
MKHYSSFVCLLTAWGLIGCGGADTTPSPSTLEPGQTEFTSVPANSGGPGRAATDSKGGVATGAPEAAPNAPTAGGNPGSGAPRTVQETDIYRLEGDRLYVLNGYRGLMVFDVSQVDEPKLIGRSPIFGQPVEMIVKDGLAVVVVADWIGTMEDGTPFHGSIVRGLDVKDAGSIRVTGEAKLGGWVRDTRVVGDVLYAVSEDYGWSYALQGESSYCLGANGRTGVGGVATPTAGVAIGPGGYGGSKAVVSSVSFAGGQIQSKGRYEVNGYSGIFNVTPNSILFAHDVVVPATPTPATEPAGTGSGSSMMGGAIGTAAPGVTSPPVMQLPTAALDYLDISDPGGTIRPRGSLQFQASVQGYGTDNGRWNLDFADGKVARVFGCGSQYCGGGNGNFSLVTADFTNPDAPTLKSQIAIAGSSWSPAVRFDQGRMYLAPVGDSYYGQTTTATPIQIFDVTDPAAPVLAGSTSVLGTVWNFTPAGNNIFTLGSSGYDATTGQWDSRITVNYLNVTDAKAPQSLGSATFGDGWAWTPAAGTFKAFTKNDQEGLVVLPFSGWSNNYQTYNNGVQLIEFTPTTIKTAGAAKTKGWVERGIFVKGRIVSLSDTALTVVDYADRANPKVTKEVTLARNIVSVQADAQQVVTVSSDFYNNNTQTSELIVVPPSQAEETASGQELAHLDIPGQNAQVFRNGNYNYVLSAITEQVDCATLPASQGGGGKEIAPSSGDAAAPALPGGGTTNLCAHTFQQIQVVEILPGGAQLLGKLKLPDGLQGWYYGWDIGFYGSYWYGGNNVVQVGGNKLAFQSYKYEPTPDGKGLEYKVLSVVDLSNPNNPVLGEQVITKELNGWGNLRAVGDTLYANHQEWVIEPQSVGDKYTPGVVRYYLDRIDLSMPGAPRVSEKINVPGMLAGASTSDPSVLYFIDYQYQDTFTRNRLNVAKLGGGKAQLLSSTQLDGYVGNLFVQNDQIYTSFQHTIAEPNNCYRDVLELLQINASNPTQLTITSTPAKGGWGWLVAVEGDVALMQSGWSQQGFDIFRLGANGPTYDRFVRTRGWGMNSLDRVGDTLYVASGPWGVQAIDLK